MNKKYKPIACGLYDELELRALRKQRVKIIFLNAKDDNELIECIITDLFSKDNTEYLKTDNGRIFRLDNIIEMDNIIFNKNC
ncbi:MAG: Rho-binding antiterminator [Ignavibacterium sp.]|nr:Rho-binding antiterminator [Ignavibacterium sp.]